MNERMVLVVEALGHWVLAWTLVVAAVSLWIGVLRPRRAAVRYGGWLLATFGGAALAPIIIAVGPLASWREFVRVLSSRPPVAATSESPAAFRSWFDGPSGSVRPELVANRASDAVDPVGSGPTSGPVRPPDLPQAQADPPAQSDRWLSLAAGIWVAGFLLFAARLVWSARAHPIPAGRGRADRTGGTPVRARSVAARAGNPSPRADRRPSRDRRADVRGIGPTGRPLADARELLDEPARAAGEPHP